MTLSTNTVCIVLSSFDKVVSIESAGKITNHYSPHFDSYDAIVEIGIDLCKFTQLFGISTSYVNVDDIITDDLKYYVYSSKLGDFKPNLHLNSIVANNPINTVGPRGEEIDQHIQKDFIRHLAKLLFNTSFATDLFTNEDELTASVSHALIQMWGSCIQELQDISTTGSSPLLQGDTGKHYLDGTANTIHNICKEIYSILMSQSPKRFSNLPSLEITDPLLQIDGIKQYHLPFYHGDEVCMKVTLKPNENQNLFGLSSNHIYTPPKFDSDGTLLGRSYLIKMKLISMNFRVFFNCALQIFLNNNSGVFTSNHIKPFFYMSFNLYLIFSLQNNINCHLLQFIQAFKLYFRC